LMNRSRLLWLDLGSTEARALGNPFGVTVMTAERDDYSEIGQLFLERR
jgi:hypothetical protein